MERKTSLAVVVFGLGLMITAAGGAGEKATGPNPPDGAVGVMSPLLQWKAGDGILQYAVYLGTTPELTAADKVAGIVTGLMYWHIPGLTPGAVYYWRVDSIKTGGTTVTGDLWHFTAAPVEAFSPKPQDGARWVKLDAELTWMGGNGALLHDVYFGADQAAVAARDASVAKGSQGAASYTPGKLQEMTTYYWAIDERGAGDVKHAGAVWSFTTTGPGGGVKAEYFNGTTPTGDAALTLVEPAIDHSWGDPGGPGAPIGNDQFSARWTADLEATATDAFTFITSSDDGVRLWLDGKLIIDDWSDHSTTEDRATVNLVCGQIYSLRMEYYENIGGAVATLSWESPSVDQEIIPAGPLQPPMHAVCAYPTPGTVDAAQILSLRWGPGDKAAQHDVYFGTDAQAVAEATPDSADIYRGRQALDELTFDPGPLEWNKTWYWRVDEINSAEAGSPWQGSVWSFKTADFLVVDDFEQYTDDMDAGQAIFQTWADGWASGDNGSQVGYTDRPFAEQKIVTGGQQSMPLDYNNVAEPYYSQAERAWATPQDWTVNGISVLQLNFRGAAGNAEEVLYVSITDKAGKVGRVAYPDSARVSFARWTAWQIPLSKFTDAGVDVTAVKKMVIGLGNLDKPAAGGAGRLLIDDIRVTRPSAAPLVLFAEDFEGLPLGKNVDEGTPGEKVWTKTAPTGWTIDDKGVPGAGDPTQDGVTEWAGWSFADRIWWATTAGDQDRSRFTLGTGTVAIADPDEWDDLDHASGRWATYLSTPAIDISAARPGTMLLTFDSSWRPEYADYGHQTGNLKVSFDGAKPVELFLWESNESSANYKAYATNETVKVNIDIPAGAKKMVLTFGLFDCGNNWWWAIDNVEVTAMSAN